MARLGAIKRNKAAIARLTAKTGQRAGRAVSIKARVARGDLGTGYLGRICLSQPGQVNAYSPAKRSRTRRGAGDLCAVAFAPTPTKALAKAAHKFGTMLAKRK